MNEIEEKDKAIKKKKNMERKIIPKDFNLYENIIEELRGYALAQHKDLRDVSNV